MNSDYDPPEFSTTTTRKARKPHRCSECRGTIAKGERYDHSSSKWEGEMCSHDTCLVCTAWAEALMTAQSEARENVGYLLGDLWLEIGDFARESLGMPECGREPADEPESAS